MEKNDLPGFDLIDYGPDEPDEPDLCLDVDFGELEVRVLAALSGSVDEFCRMMKVRQFAVMYGAGPKQIANLTGEQNESGRDLPFNPGRGTRDGCCHGVRSVRGLQPRV